MAKDKIKPETITPSKEKTQERVQMNSRIPDYIWEEAKKEMKLVKGRFRLYEQGRQGGSEKITWRKYPEEICPMFSMSMKDGEVYEIPLYAARYINGFDSGAPGVNGNTHYCQVAKHGFKMQNPADLKASTATDTGAGVPSPIAGITRYDKRMGFESLEFSSAIE